MSAEYLALTRAGYDATAAAYAERFHSHLDGKPLELAVLTAFGRLVGPGGRVLDVGCGTGATTAILAAHGCAVTGVDLSPQMVAEARRRNPGLPFEVRSMTALDAADGTADGVCAWYSTIHVPDEDLPQVFGEFRRVLRPGGHLLLAFQVGERPRLLDEAFGVPVRLTFHRRIPAAVSAMLTEQGLHRYAELVREPDDDGIESTPQAFLIARRPAECPPGG